MSISRAACVIVSVALHAGLLWWVKPHNDAIPLAGGEPTGAKVDVDLVDPGPLQEATPPPEETPPPEPPQPEPPPPEPAPPEPVPPPMPEPPPPPPDAIEEPTPAPVTEPPKPKPQPKSMPRPATPQRPRSGPAQASTAPTTAGNAPGASAGSATGEARARFKNKVTPVYPASLRRSGIIGRVMVVATVGPQGRAISVRISRSSGNALFDQAALSATRASEFYPKKTLGVAVEDTVSIPYSFESQN